MVGVCSRLKAHYQKSSMMIAGSSAAEDAGKPKPSGSIMWDTINVECDGNGNFLPRQCNDVHCWCVDRQGQVMENTHSRNKDITCGRLNN